MQKAIAVGDIDWGKNCRQNAIVQRHVNVDLADQLHQIAAHIYQTLVTRNRIYAAITSFAENVIVVAFVSIAFRIETETEMTENNVKEMIFRKIILKFTTESALGAGMFILNEWFNRNKSIKYNCYYWNACVEGIHNEHWALFVLFSAFFGWSWTDACCDSITMNTRNKTICFQRKI